MHRLPVNKELALAMPCRKGHLYWKDDASKRKICKNATTGAALVAGPLPRAKSSQACSPKLYSFWWLNPYWVTVCHCDKWYVNPHQVTEIAALASYPIRWLTQLMLPNAHSSSPRNSSSPVRRGGPCGPQQVHWLSPRPWRPGDGQDGTSDSRVASRRCFVWF